VRNKAPSLVAIGFLPEPGPNTLVSDETGLKSYQFSLAAIPLGSLGEFHA
jgi:hypothetical protein